MVNSLMLYTVILMQCISLVTNQLVKLEHWCTSAAHDDAGVNLNSQIQKKNFVGLCSFTMKGWANFVKY